MPSDRLATPSVPADGPATASASRSRLLRLVTWASLAVASILIVTKLLAWLATGSVAMLSSLIDSALDLLASGIAWFAVRQALTPADREHRFGHGKAEALAAFAQAGFIIASALGLALAAGDRILHPQAVTHEEVGLAVTALAIALTIGLVAFQRHVVRRTGSMAVGADSLHYLGDLMANATVIVVLLLSARFNVPWLDAAGAILIAFYLLFGVRTLLQRSLDVLMDHELPDDQRERIKAIVRAHPAVRDLHDLRTRTSGTTRFIQMHVELDPQTSLIGAHQKGNEIEAAIRRDFPDAEIILHLDPHGLDEAARLVAPAGSAGSR
ncbi:cation diffusion facilitator family transporter [Reyranella sp. CPCC 100927]|uniref:cation diffusion facilitator family transporter n=1 Tax=Reyranella sp. CPCC 100927 TaxID=2599616 RepID=UPI0011B36674|nr:cation diffusion facilitator family transporter [Reyranella sp. CPCC 100927]TWT12783.1 cation diffusion facilitator family transporter [Reyranella sp. CPCC 100927]